MLVLPAHSSVAAKRVLIHWADDSARRSTLAVAARICYVMSRLKPFTVGILPERLEWRSAATGSAFARCSTRALKRRLCMVSRCASELRFGAAADELQRQLNESQDPMLILGVSDPAQLRGTFGELFTSGATYPMMVVYRPSKDNEGAAE